MTPWPGDPPPLPRPGGSAGILNNSIVILNGSSSITGNHPDNCAGAPVTGCLG